jgi:hypothetical protein
MIAATLMSRQSAVTAISLMAALVLFVSALVSAAWISQDATPLLTFPRPDLRIPLGLAGIAAGVVAAKWMAGLPHMREQRARWVFFVMLPLCFFLGFFTGCERLFELYSFRRGVRAPRLAVVQVSDKSLNKGRRGRPDSYEAHLRSPFGGRRIDLKIDQNLFERMEPSRDCLDLLVERAPNGAVRLVKVVGASERTPPCSA